MVMRPFSIHVRRCSHKAGQQASYGESALPLHRHNTCSSSNGQRSRNHLYHRRQFISLSALLQDHPDCINGSKCENKKCGFKHPDGSRPYATAHSASASTVPAQCWMKHKCPDPNCTSDHPRCNKGDACDNPRCGFLHSDGRRHTGKDPADDPRRAGAPTLPPPPPPYSTHLFSAQASQAPPTYSTQYAGVNVAQRPSTYSPHYSGASASVPPAAHTAVRPGLQVTAPGQISRPQQRGAAPDQGAHASLAIGGTQRTAAGNFNAAGNVLPTHDKQGDSRGGPRCDKEGEKRGGGREVVAKGPEGGGFASRSVSAAAGTPGSGNRDATHGSDPASSSPHTMHEPLGLAGSGAGGGSGGGAAPGGDILAGDTYLKVKATVKEITIDAQGCRSAVVKPTMHYFSKHPEFAQAAMQEGCAYPCAYLPLGSNEIDDILAKGDRVSVK
eukprot:gene16952-23227_t